MAEVGQHRIELATALLLSTAGLFSAWASYQASLWGGVQASHYARASAKMTEASRLSIVDGQLVGTDNMMFRSWLEAAADNDQPRMQFYERRFSPALQSVFKRWRARYPGDLRRFGANPPPPASFEKPRHREGVEAAALQAAATAELAEGDNANATGDRYVASTVLLSLVLFLGGISPQLENLRIRRMMLGIATLIGLAAAVMILRLPVQTL
jgi:hypothetical protein